MKKTIALLLTAVLAVSTCLLSACGMTTGTSAAGTSEASAAASSSDAGSTSVSESSSAAETVSTAEAETTGGEDIECLANSAKYLNDELTYKDVPYYVLYSMFTTYGTLAFADDNYEVPYISITEAVDVMKAIVTVLNQSGMNMPDPEYTIEKNEDEHSVLLTRNNGAAAYFNADENLISISNVDGIGFTVRNLGEIMTISAGSTADNVVYLLQNEERYNMAKDGNGFSADIYDSYGIRMYYQDDEVYIPFAIFNDIFMGQLFNVVYNGENAFILSGSPDNTIENDDGLTMCDIYYSPEPHERSEALAQLTYGELCFTLDLQYGLKEAHGISTFNEYFMATGLYENLLSTDPEEFDLALSELMNSSLDDVHSTYLANSAYTGIDYEDAVNWDKTRDCARYRSFLFDEKLNEERYDAGLVDENGTIINAYEEVGDTAYITFDSFNTYAMDPTRYYNMVSDDGSIDMTALEECYMEDTLGLVIYANQMVNREGSPVKNIVIDLSANGGGAVDAAAYIAAWVLGDAQINTRNQATGAQYSYNYTADVDLDGRITDADSLDLDRFDVYCLESSSSFSCGNLVPSLFKSSGEVTLIGQKSGGGACAVYSNATADGTFYRFSSNSQLCIVMNGSFYSVDEGIEPDIYIKHLEKMYDREWLTQYIDNID